MKNCDVFKGTTFLFHAAAASKQRVSLSTLEKAVVAE